jgi:hypothetical protein
MKKILYIALALLATACTRYNPTPRTVLPTEYSSAWQEIYGHCYDSIPCAVVALDLYSEGLELDKNHRMKGTGYNLYISDIFVPDSMLAAGSYKSDKSGEAFTFLPGRDWDGTPTGMYLLRIEEGKLQSIQVLDSGLLVVKDTTNSLTDLQFTLYYKNAYGNKVTYTTHFQGTLQPWLKK